MDMADRKWIQFKGREVHLVQLESYFWNSDCLLIDVNIAQNSRVWTPLWRPAADRCISVSSRTYTNPQREVRGLHRASIITGPFVLPFPSSRGALG